eukprot:606250-Prymnesium_polylepis.2
MCIRDSSPLARALTLRPAPSRRGAGRARAAAHRPVDLPPGKPAPKAAHPVSLFPSGRPPCPP